MKKPFLLIAVLSFAFYASAQLPQLKWARAPLCMPGSATSVSVATDVSGNVYSSGTSRGKTDFDPGAAYDTAGTSNAGSFLVKYDSTGKLVWRRSVAGAIGAAVTTDDSGNVFQSGTFNGTVSFGAGASAVTRTTPGVSNFLAKYTPQGTLTWVRNVCINGTYIGNVMGAGALVADRSGNIYQGGEYFSSADSLVFDSARRYSLVLPWSRLKDSYLAKWDRNGILQWVRQVSGGDGEQINRVCISPKSGDIIIGGYVTGGDLLFPPNTRVYASLGASDGFVAGYTSGGNFLWAKRIGGTNHDFFNDLAVDSKGAIAVSGFDYTDPYQTTSEAFIIKVDDTGAIQWRKNYGDHVAVGRAIAVDDSDNIYSDGMFDSTANFNPGNNIIYKSLSKFDMYLLKLRPNGSYVWSKSFTGRKAVSPERLWIDKRMNIYAAGSFYDSCDFNPGGSGGGIIANNHPGASQEGAFTVRFDQLGKPNAGVSVSVSQLPAISVFPNPAAHALRVKGLPAAGQYEFIITDMTGRHYPLSPVSHGSDDVLLELGNMPPACYILTCRDRINARTWQNQFVKAAE